MSIPMAKDPFASLPCLASISIPISTHWFTSLFPFNQTFCLLSEKIKLWLWIWICSLDLPLASYRELQRNEAIIKRTGKWKSGEVPEVCDEYYITHITHHHLHISIHPSISHSFISSPLSLLIFIFISITIMDLLNRAKHETKSLTSALTVPRSRRVSQTPLQYLLLLNPLFSLLNLTQLLILFSHASNSPSESST